MQRKTRGGSLEQLRIGNCSGFYGDRQAAAREMVEGGPLDVLTGDYLAELTMLILWRSSQRSSGVGYARTFLKQMREILAICKSRRIAVVVNAGGLDPAGLAQSLREIAHGERVDVNIASIEGDDLMPRLDSLADLTGGLRHLDSGDRLSDSEGRVVTANAYLGGWGIARALSDGAEIVVTGRVTDASLVVGPAAYHHGWKRDDWNKLAGAVVAGHIIECGTQATGGNYAFFEEVPGIERIGFPIAEIFEDGSSVITKHKDTGGAVSIGTVTAQLLYEIERPAYLNPDVTALFDTIELVEESENRIRVQNVVGTAPTKYAKVCINTLAGYRNDASFVLTGLDIDAKANVLRSQLENSFNFAAIGETHWRLVRNDQVDSPDNASATAELRVSVKHREREPIDRKSFSAACVELALGSYPGFFMTEPPSDARPYGMYWPTLVPASEVHEVVAFPDGSIASIPQTGATLGSDSPHPHKGAQATSRFTGQRARGDFNVSGPLGRIVGARSGDKGGNANVGLWVRSLEHYTWLLETVGSADRVRTLLPEAAEHPVDVFEFPNLLAINVVIRGLLGQGVASSTRPDPQAKGLGEFLRSRTVDIPRSFLAEGHEK